MSDDMKYDGGKARMDLLPMESLMQVAAVYGFGAAKYAPNKWRWVSSTVA